MSDDLAAAVITDGCELVDCTLETVEGMTSAGRHHLEGQVIIVTAHFTFRHQHNLSVALPRTPIVGLIAVVLGKPKLSFRQERVSVRCDTKKSCSAVFTNQNQRRTMSVMRVVLMFIATGLLLVESGGVAKPAGTASIVSPAPVLTPSTTRVDFDTQLKPIFKSKCMPCHFNGGHELTN